MRTLDIILLVIAVACFAAAAVNAKATKVNLVALGLLAWVLVPLIALIQAGS